MFSRSSPQHVDPALDICAEGRNRTESRRLVFVMFVGAQVRKVMSYRYIVASKGKPIGECAHGTRRSSLHSASCCMSCACVECHFLRMHDAPSVRSSWETRKKDVHDHCFHSAVKIVLNVSLSLSLSLSRSHPSYSVVVIVVVVACARSRSAVVLLFVRLSLQHNNNTNELRRDYTTCTTA